jgi:hypothetical protein
MCSCALWLAVAVPVHAQAPFADTRAAAQDEYGGAEARNEATSPAPSGGGKAPTAVTSKPRPTRGNTADPEADPEAAGVQDDRGPGAGGQAAPDSAANTLPTQRSQGVDLPFTGLEVGTIAFLGLLLLVLGLSLAAAQRWAARRHIQA